MPNLILSEGFLAPLCTAKLARRLRQIGTRCHLSVGVSAAAQEQPFDLVSFTVIVDDIVYPDGSTRMQQLGGGG
jgi:hypothetical protein